MSASRFLPQQLLSLSPESGLEHSSISALQMLSLVSTWATPSETLKETCKWKACTSPSCPQTSVPWYGTQFKHLKSTFNIVLAAYAVNSRPSLEVSRISRIFSLFLIQCCLRTGNIHRVDVTCVLVTWSKLINSWNTSEHSAREITLPELHLRLLLVPQSCCQALFYSVCVLIGLRREIHLNASK